eukprot:280302-Chlamydomonas_euryale.AAC.3
MRGAAQPIPCPITNARPGPMLGHQCSPVIRIWTISVVPLAEAAAWVRPLLPPGCGIAALAMSLLGRATEGWR